MLLNQTRTEIDIWTQRWQGKQKQMETMLLRYQPSVTCNSRTVQKKVFSILLKLWTNGSVGEKCVSDFFLIVIETKHSVQILKCFHSEFMYSVASDYYENKRVINFLAKFLYSLPKWL